MYKRTLVRDRIVAFLINSLVLTFASKHFRKYFEAVNTLGHQALNDRIEAAERR